MQQKKEKKIKHINEDNYYKAEQVGKKKRRRRRSKKMVGGGDRRPLPAHLREGKGLKLSDRWEERCQNALHMGKSI